MVAVKAGDVEATLRRRPGAAVYLFYGPDTGLVNERARRVAREAVSDPDDPFQLVRLDGDAVAGDPGRLVDEAGTIGLFGGQRVVWVSATTRSIVPAVQALLAAPAGGATVVVEAGDLNRSAPLRTLCEKAPNALALPCFPDNARDLGALVDTTLRDAGLSIARDVRETLLAMLGADRSGSRSELEKLVLYTAGTGQVTAQDVEAVVGDVSALAMDGVVDGAFAGRFAVLDRAWTRLAAEGLDAGVVIGAALRHALQLLRWRAAMEADRRAAGEVVPERALHFSRRDGVLRQLTGWTTAALGAAVDDLSRAQLAVRRQPALARETARQALWSVATAARRAGIK